MEVLKERERRDFWVQGLGCYRVQFSRFILGVMVQGFRAQGFSEGFRGLGCKSLMF